MALKTLVAIISLGVFTRLVPLGWVIWDKYLGDALYAAMIYVLVQFLTRRKPTALAALAMLIMTAIELFQLTLIPQHLLTSPSLSVKLTARLLGTQFSLLDLATYGIGIALTFLLARQPRSNR